MLLWSRPDSIVLRNLQRHVAFVAWGIGDFRPTATDEHGRKLSS